MEVISNTDLSSFHIQCNFRTDENDPEGSRNILYLPAGLTGKEQHCEASNTETLPGKFPSDAVAVEVTVTCSPPHCWWSSSCPHGCAWLHKSGRLCMVSWTYSSRCSEVQSADRRFIFLPFTAAPALSRLEPVIHEHQSRSFALFLQLNERCRRHLPYNSRHHSPSLFVLLCLPSALCHISSGWSIPISSNWWTSLRPKRSTSSSLNCEFRCLMSRGGGGGEGSLPVSAAARVGELNVLIIDSWGMSCCSLGPARYENSSELHSFGIQIWLLSSGGGSIQILSPHCKRYLVTSKSLHWKWNLG